MDDIIKQLEIAKGNVRELLDNPDALIDLHGIAYWAGVVERLRNKIKELL